MHPFITPKVCGTATLGERGQIVIPSKIRSSMKLKEGEKFLVFSRSNRFIGMIRAADMDKMLDHIAGKFMEGMRKIKDEISK
jgi:AbrB family looped-hinge helix DNA binding protein